MTVNTSRFFSRISCARQATALLPHLPSEANTTDFDRALFEFPQLVEQRLHIIYHSMVLWMRVEVPPFFREAPASRKPQASFTSCVPSRTTSSRCLKLLVGMLSSIVSHERMEALASCWQRRSTSRICLLSRALRSGLLSLAWSVRSVWPVCCPRLSVVCNGFERSSSGLGQQ